MESYMLILYVTINQEEAIRQLFIKQGWKYIKEDGEITVVKDNGLSGSSQVDHVIGRTEEGSFHFEVSCLDENESRHSNTNITTNCIQDEKFADGSQGNCIINDIFRNDIEDSVNGIHGNRSVNDIKDDEFVSDIQCSSVVNGILDSCDINGTCTSDNSIVGVKQHITQNEDSCTMNYEPDVRVACEEQNDNALVKENQQSFTAYSTPEIRKEESSYSDETDKEKTSTDQLKHLISRGKLLSIENKRRLNKERKALHQKSHRKLQKCHSANTAKKKPIFCSECKVTFTSQKRFDTHKARNNGQCVFPCEFCDKVFLYRKSRYDLHVRSAHSKERPFKCDVCQKGYVTSDKLKIHKRVHTGERPCVCEECGKAFYSRGDLSTHREYHHISKERQDNVTCDICNLTFCNQRYLAYHKNVTHSTRRDFHCQTCSKSFKSNSSLRRHLKYIHSESKNFKCDACEKSFKTAGSLKKHKVRHVGERSFFCSECNKGFYEKAKLDQHFRTHTGEKPYKCHLCEYKCALSGNLSKHMKTHYRELTNAVL